MSLFLAAAALCHFVVQGAQQRKVILSEEPLIELYPGFLADDEMLDLRSLAEEEMFSDLADPESGSSSSPDVAGGEEISMLNLSESEDSLQWDLLKETWGFMRATEVSLLTDEVFFIPFNYKKSKSLHKK